MAQLLVGVTAGDDNSIGNERQNGTAGLHGDIGFCCHRIAAKDSNINLEHGIRIQRGKNQLQDLNKEWCTNSGRFPWKTSHKASINNALQNVGQNIVFLHFIHDIVKCVSV